jgi:GDPmannose 4,6-dehydratase
LLSLSTVKNIKIEVVSERIRPIDADLQVPDTRKFINHTGWAPEISFEKTMFDLLEYWREKIKVDGERFLTR